MQFFNTYISRVFILFFIVLISWSVFLMLTHQKDTQWNFLFNPAYALLYFTGGLIALFGVKTAGFKYTVGKELFSIGIGMLGFAIGLFIWSYYNIILKVDIPYPSLADVFFVLYIPFIGYGIINSMRVFGFFYSKRIFIESLIIFIIATVLTFTFGNPRELPDSLSVFAKALNIFYLLGDSFLISLGIMLIRLTKGKIYLSFFYFIGALFVMASADFLFSYRTAANIYWNGDIADVLYAFSGLLFCLGVVRIIATQKAVSSFKTSH